MQLDRSKIMAIIGLLLMGIFLLFNQMLVRGRFLNNNLLTVWIFDIGQGDAIFIDGPERQVLIDGGPNFSILEKLPAVMLPFDRVIDYVVLTHPHLDHLMGLLPVLERYEVGQVLDSGQGYGTAEFSKYEQITSAQSVQTGDVIDLGGGATLTVLWPHESYDGAKIDDPNDGSVVLLLEYGQTNMLLTGDAGVKEEAAFIKSSFFSEPELGSASHHVDILKTGHHGSRTSSSEELLSAITPDIAIMSVAAENDYGLPDEDVLWRLSEAGVVLYRTDLHGDIRIMSDGGEPSVKLFDL